MLNISKYLEKFKKNLESGENLTNTVIEIIKNHTNIELQNSDFEVKNNLVLLKTSPGVKNKIFISKSGIVTEIEERTTLKNVEIR